MLEGQLGTLKDPDFGIYPMVTSSSTLAGYGCVGAGIPPHEVKDIVVVTKAYSSAVGAGEFVSEIFGDEAQELRIHGGDKGEFGATTGRPRRVGWFDCVASRYGIECQGATQVVMTALDCLSYLEEIKVCVGYDIDGEVTKDFPTTSKRQSRCSKPLKAGTATLGASRNLTSSLRKHRTMFSLLKTNSATRLIWYQTALKEKQSFTEIKNLKFCRGELCSPLFSAIK